MFNRSIFAMNESHLSDSDDRPTCNYGKFIQATKIWHTDTEFKSDKSIESQIVQESGMLQRRLQETSVTDLLAGIRFKVEQLGQSSSSGILDDVTNDGLTLASIASPEALARRQVSPRYRRPGMRTVRRPGDQREAWQSSPFDHCFSPRGVLGIGSAKMSDGPQNKEVTSSNLFLTAPNISDLLEHHTFKYRLYVTSLAETPASRWPRPGVHAKTQTGSPERRLLHLLHEESGPAASDPDLQAVLSPILQDRVRLLWTLDPGASPIKPRAADPGVIGRPRPLSWRDQRELEESIADILGRPWSPRGPPTPKGQIRCAQETHTQTVQEEAVTSTWWSGPPTDGPTDVRVSAPASPSRKKPRLSAGGKEASQPGQIDEDEHNQGGDGGDDASQDVAPSTGRFAHAQTGDEEADPAREAPSKRPLNPAAQAFQSAAARDPASWYGSGPPAGATGGVASTTMRLGQWVLPRQAVHTPMVRVVGPPAVHAAVQIARPAVRAAVQVAPPAVHTAVHMAQPAVHRAVQVIGPAPNAWVVSAPFPVQGPPVCVSAAPAAMRRQPLATSHMAPSAAHYVSGALDTDGPPHARNSNNHANVYCGDDDETADLVDDAPNSILRPTDRGQQIENQPGAAGSAIPVLQPTTRGQPTFMMTLRDTSQGQRTNLVQVPVRTLQTAVPSTRPPQYLYSQPANCNHPSHQPTNGGNDTSSQGNLTSHNFNADLPPFYPRGLNVDSREFIPEQHGSHTSYSSGDGQHSGTKRMPHVTPASLTSPGRNKPLDPGAQEFSPGKRRRVSDEEIGRDGTMLATTAGSVQLGRTHEQPPDGSGQPLVDGGCSNIVDVLNRKSSQSASQLEAARCRQEAAQRQVSVDSLMDVAKSYQEQLPRIWQLEQSGTGDRPFASLPPPDRHTLMTHGPPPPFEGADRPLLTAMQAPPLPKGDSHLLAFLQGLPPSRP